MGFATKIAADFNGLRRVVGAPLALRWLGAIAQSTPAILRHRNLLSADQLMGRGPFTVRHKVGSAKLLGDGAFSGLREIWVRDVYARADFLRIPDGGTVVDLGANMGNFSAQALAAQPTARLYAVEASRVMAEKWARTMAINGFEDRAVLDMGFIGPFTVKQDQARAEEPAYADTPTISEAEFLRRHAITKIDFLKCDIEGSEFFMLAPESRLLAISSRVAIEVHGFGGDTNGFIDGLRQRGFEIVSVDWDGPDCILRAWRPE